MDLHKILSIIVKPFFYWLLVYVCYYIGKEIYPDLGKFRKWSLPSYKHYLIGLIPALIVMFGVAYRIGMKTKDGMSNGVDYNKAVAWFIIFTIPFVSGYRKAYLVDKSLTDEQRREKYNHY